MAVADLVALDLDRASDSKHSTGGLDGVSAACAGAAAAMSATAADQGDRKLHGGAPSSLGPRARGAARPECHAEKRRRASSSSSPRATTKSEGRG